jgi:hypothetical protein
MLRKFKDWGEQKPLKHQIFASVNEEQGSLQTMGFYSAKYYFLGLDEEEEPLRASMIAMLEQ